jgi:serine/threonine protein kinase
MHENTQITTQTSFDMSYYNLDVLIHNLDIFDTQFIIDTLIKITPKRAIYIVLDKNENKKKILKVLVKSSVTNTQMQIYDMLMSLYHPNICEIENIIDKGMFLILVMKYINGDTMCTYFKKSRTHDIYNKILFDLVLTLNYLHSKNIIHGDIKPDNIIITPNGIPIIIDFDLSKLVNNKLLVTKIFGTKFFMAPEMVFKEYITTKIDVWSLGMTLYVCCLKYIIPDVFIKNTSAEYDKQNNIICQYFDKLCKKYGKLIITSMQAMLIEDQNTRPTFDALITILQRSKKFKLIYSNIISLNEIKYGMTPNINTINNEYYITKMPEIITNVSDGEYIETIDLGLTESYISVDNDDQYQINDTLTIRHNDDSSHRSFTA